MQRTGDVVDDDGDGRVADVRGDEGAEPLLAGRVPQLQADGAVVEVHGLREEVNANGGLLCSRGGLGEGGELEKAEQERAGVKCQHACSFPK